MAPGQDPNRDLGFGSRVAERSPLRLLNRDGSFNVRRRGLPLFRSLSVYHSLLTMSWWRFHLVVLLAYLGANVIFAFAYLLCGPGALNGVTASTSSGRFAEAFFFSVHTMATVGYGNVSPASLVANLIVTVEALSGLLGFALATGLLFTRFSRPSARILFSNRAVIAPYRGGKALMFRLANARSSQLTQVEATVVLSRYETTGGPRARRFYTMKLERERVMFLPLHWVVVHPINGESPLEGASAESLAAADAEILVLLAGVDETFSATVHARTSYKHDEILWGMRFVDIFDPVEAGVITVNLQRLHEVGPE